MTQKTKLVGLGAFFLFIICFIIELVSSFINIDAVKDAGAYQTDFVILFVFGIIVSLALIANSVFGVVKLLKQDDRDAAFRRASDGIGGFGVYLAFTEIYTIILMNRIANDYGVTYNVPAAAIIIMILTIIAAGLAAVGSIKKIKLSPAIRCLLLAIAALILFVVAIIAITQDNQKALVVVEYVFLMLSLVAFIVFAYFCYDEQKDNVKPSQNKSEEDYNFEENDSQSEDWFKDDNSNQSNDWFKDNNSNK